MIIIKKYLKIFLLLGAAFIISDFSIKNVFLAKSPKFNPFFTQNIIAKVSNIWTKTTNFFAFRSIFPSSNDQINQANFNQKPTNQTFTLKEAPKDIIEALNTPLTKVSQGVYAGEKNNIRVYEIRTNEIEYLEYTFNINGKEVKIKVPKDQQPPSQEVVEALYK